MTKTKATLIGSMAIILWSFDTILNLFLARLPVVEVLAFSWIIASVFFSFTITYRKAWHSVKQPFLWGIGSVGICGAHAAHLVGLRLAPAEQITTLAALWPILVVVIGGWLLNKERVSWLSYFGVILGFLGATVVITGGNLFTGFQAKYTNAYGFALLSSLLWTMYVIMSRKYAHFSSLIIGIYLAIGGLVALGILVFTGTMVMPNNKEGLLLLIKGGLTLSGAYLCWDYAIKHGHFTLLNVLAYFNPILTITLLALFGLSEALAPIWIGAVLVVLATMLCSEFKKKDNKQEN